MYLSIGSNTVVRTSEIVAVFDLETTSVSHRTRDFLKQCEKKGIVVNICEDIPKTYILCEHEGRETVYISQISSATLLKRAE